MLRPLTLDEIAEVTGGGVVDGVERGGMSGEETVSFVSTDTRTIKPGSLFVALVGETHDGHNFLQAAADAGATAFMLNRTLKDGEPKLPHVVVPDTLHALGDIARLLRDEFTGAVVGVTGSVGKTTTKELIAAILGTTFNVCKTVGNHNNEIGVPQTIFDLEPTHTALVVEMGMRGVGEIRRLCEIAAPTIGVVTGIGTSHIERLGSREAIAEAKGELLEMLPPDGVAIFPADDPYANDLARKFAGRKLMVRVLPPEPPARAEGYVAASEVSAQDNGYRFTVHTATETQKFFLPSPGEFNVKNTLLAVAVGDVLGVPLDDASRAVNKWKAPAMRLEVLTSPTGVTILSDAYNAAPDSMVGALKTLRDAKVGANGKRIAVLGEMRELGAFADEGHLLVGRAVAGLAKPDMLALVGGDNAHKMAAGAIAEGFSPDNIHYFEGADTAAPALAFVVQPGDAVLVKGSRAMALELVVNALMQTGAK
ncbi:MAG: UDP-N-acetylmuramoyl-tripeptide--D-alanyl-D-alanine ligase [Armatimonadetes bacterium]|nr:UDP-N-acetylmuramoyl-tripeptide--D-alanyl-D-alanine ligase [Armatimonadota bacterium]